VFDEVLRVTLKCKALKQTEGKCLMCLQILLDARSKCNRCNMDHCEDCIEIWEDGFQSCYKCGQEERIKRNEANIPVVVLKPRLCEGYPINFQLAQDL